MESVNYLRALLRSWWLILLVLVAGGAGGYLVYARETPLYESSIRLVVAPRAKATDAVSAQALTTAQAQSLAQAASTPPGLQDAAKAAGLPGATPIVSATAVTGQPFVFIVVVDADPDVARRIADAFPATVTGTKARLLGPDAAGFEVTALARATVPGDPISPDVKRDVGLGLVGGLVLGLALALLREALNRTVRDSDELRRITELTVLGTVPRHLPKVLMPTMSHPRSPRAEAYRQIRTAATSASHRRPLTIAVTSASQAEGKTSLSTNLAAALSRAGHKVALVDADLRRPQVATYFGLEPEYGLTDVLTGEVPLEKALVLLEGERLAVLTAGRIPSNPSEALGSSAMETVLAELAAACEFVIVDTPPVLPVTDALVLAPMVDGVILVARLGRTTRDRVRRAKAAIDRVNATVFGVVANHAGRGVDADYFYPYRYAPKKNKDEDPAETSVPEAGLRSPEEPTGAHSAFADASRTARRLAADDPGHAHRRPTPGRATAHPDVPHPDVPHPGHPHPAAPDPAAPLPAASEGDDEASGGPRG